MNTKKLSSSASTRRTCRRRSTTSTRCSPTSAAKLPKNEPVIEFGNKEGYGTIHFFGGIQGAYGSAQPMRDWIYHVPGSTLRHAENIQALRS